MVLTQLEVDVILNAGIRRLVEYEFSDNKQFGDNHIVSTKLLNDTEYYEKIGFKFITFHFLAIDELKMIILDNNILFLIPYTCLKDDISSSRKYITEIICKELEALN